MLKLDIIDQTGKKIGEEKLEPKIFGVKPDPHLIKQAVVTQLANKRTGIAQAKTKGEVRGGGKKPWRQKGTGRARHGSIRSPLWRGGGVIFGPRADRNFSLKINRKAKKKALFMSLTDKYENKKIVLLNKISIDEAKTKKFLALIKKLPIDRTYLTILPKTDFTLIRASNNLKHTKCLRADSLNVYDIMKYDQLLIDKEALAVIRKTYLK